ncbi:MAG: hypothetical protein NTX48_04945 [Planctomycetales bacterium]|nr:hypothetical protein [Planctomycetales bacterium]
MMPFESFVEAGIRRNAVRDALRFLAEHSHLEPDGQASHPIMPRAKRRNKGPKRCNGYRFRLPGGESDLIPYTLQSASAQKRLFDRPPKPPFVRYRDDLTPTHKALAIMLLHFEIDMEIVRQVLTGHKCSIAQMSYLQFQAEQVAQKQHYAVRCSTGRLATSMTALPAIFRPALRLNGSPLAECDAGCCNYVLFASILQNDRTISPQDLSSFQGWSETGRLYDVIAAEIGTSRDVIKKPVLSYLGGPDDFTCSRLRRQLNSCPDWWEVCQKSNEFGKVCEVALWFRETLPSIHRFLSTWKTSDDLFWKSEAIRSQRTGNKRKGPHAVVSRTLQQLEANVFIESCSKHLLEKYPAAVFATIHDSLLLPVSFVPAATTELRNSFAELGLSPKIKITRLQAT